MKYDACPNCGGTVRAESIGWKCNNCRGFISLQDGKFYEYVEKPFMPPQTNADRIRAMSDEELLDFFRYRGCPPDRLTGKCVKVGVCEECWADWLKQPAEEE